MTRTMYIDIDSTIWPAEVEYTRVEMEKFGTDKLAQNFYSYDDLQLMYGKDFKKLLYEALHPDLVMHREMYPGVHNAITMLHFGMGFDIHFISHNWYPAESEGPIRKWLEHEFGPALMTFDFTIYDEGNCKASTMDADPTAWGLIEDKPATMEQAWGKGYKVYAKLQTWNESYVIHRPAIKGFAFWNTVPELVEMDLTSEELYGRVKESV